MNGRPETIQNETEITELTIGIDGRIYVFGLSQQILNVLQAIAPTDATIKRLTAQTKLLSVRQNDGGQ
ncbi:MAG TPA: hypothetical protein VGG19_08135 [Tepidisphaeraceae bacterium]|jgi:hypothetical protein